jgi:MarR family transcriptional regulator for hemolysin
LILAGIASRLTSPYSEGLGELLTLFTRAAKLLRTAADDAMSPHGVRVGQNIILEALWQQDGLTPGEIARRLDVATPTVVNTATRMETAGLITRRHDSTDARLVRLHLTDRGHAVKRAVQRERDKLERRATLTLTPLERRNLKSALAKIIDVLSPDDTKARPGSGGER